MFAVFLVFYVARVIQLDLRIPALGEIYTEMILGIAVSVTAIYALITTPTRWMPNCFKLGIAFLTLMAVMTVFSYDVGLSWKIFYEHAFKDMLVGLAIIAFVDTPRRLSVFFAAHFLAFAKMAEEGIRGLLNGTLVWENQGVMRLHGSTPNYNHPNSLSGTQLGSIPFTTVLATQVPKWTRLFLYAEILVALIVVVYTGSRTAYIAIAGSAIVFCFRSRRPARNTLLMLVLMLAMIPLVPQDYIERFGTVFTQKDKLGSGSIDLRKEILRDATTIFMEHPLGVGVAAFPTVRNTRFGRTQDTHNLYLEISTNLGVEGLLLFSALIFSMTRSLMGIARRADAICRASAQPESISSVGSERTRGDRKIRPNESADETTAKLVSATARALIAFIVLRLFLGAFGHDLYEPYWWFAIGLTCALARMLSEIEPKHVDVAKTSDRTLPYRVAEQSQKLPRSV